jgi:maltooligosyltrehalose trehalohydrolase
MLFQGEEYGETRPFQFFSDHAEPLGSAVTAGRLEEFARHGWDAEATVPDPQDPATFAASKLDRSASAETNVALRAWLREVMAARPLTLVRGGWRANPVSIAERAPRQLTMDGPVRVHANLSDVPVAYEGRLLAAFGTVAVAGEGFVLEPDAVALAAGRVP